jgi:hypothetical protein
MRDACVGTGHAHPAGVVVRSRGTAHRRAESVRTRRVAERLASFRPRRPAAHDVLLENNEAIDEIAVTSPTGIVITTVTLLDF